MLLSTAADTSNLSIHVDRMAIQKQVYNVSNLQCIVTNLRINLVIINNKSRKGISIIQREYSICLETVTYIAVHQVRIERD